VFVPPRELPKITPFEAAKIRLASLWTMLFEQLHTTAIVAVGERLRGQRHVGDVFVTPRRGAFTLGPTAQLRFLLLSGERVLPCIRSAHGLPN